MSLGGYLPPVVAEVVSEIGKYSAGMGEVKAEMSSLEAANTKLAAAGKVAMAGLAVAVAGVGFESVKMASAFDQQMELIHTQAGASQAEVDGLKDKVLALAPAVGIGPEKLAEGLYHIESTGMRGAAAVDVLTQAAKLAQIGMADLDDVTYAMSGVMSVGMKDIHGAADAISYLNATVGMGDMRMSQLTAAIGTGILPSFKSAGLGMVDFSAAIATITDNSTSADEAATRLRMTVAMMAAPSGPAVDALKSIGLSSLSLATDLQKPDGLLVAVQDLKKHLEASGKSAVEQNSIIEHAFGGGKTSGAILTLLEETDRLKSKYEQLGTEASRAAATQDAWAQQQKQFSQQWAQLEATLQAYGVKIGNWLIPKLQAAAGWIGTHTGLIKELAKAISGPLALAMAAWIVSLGVAAVENVAATWEILLIIAAVAALAYGIWWLVENWTTAWTWIKHIASNVWTWMQLAWHDFVAALIGEYQPIIDDWVQLWHNMEAPVTKFWHFLQPILADIRAGVALLTGDFGSNVKSAVGGKLPHFADGGTVPGPTGAPLLAVVHGGEQILSNDQVAAMAAGRGGSSGSAGAGSPSGGSSGDQVIQQKIYLDNKVVWQGQLRYARRSGQTPAQLYPDSVSGLNR